MKKIILGIVLAGLVLGGCGATTNTNVEKNIEQSVVTKTGTITTKSTEGYLMTTADGIINLTSTKVNLENYLKIPAKTCSLSARR